GPSGYYGGILRDYRGKRVRGFQGFISESDSLTAEFHGIYNGGSNKKIALIMVKARLSKLVGG
nr:polynucleotidyl transferase, ribonuclease H-like superfamily protein 1 [Tanacetum cinerariifolium]